MQLIQNHHSNSNNMLGPYKEGVLRREEIPESIFLAASGTKAMEMLPGFPWPASACGLESHPAWKQLLDFQKNCRLSVVI